MLKFWFFFCLIDFFVFDIKDSRVFVIVFRLVSFFYIIYNLRLVMLSNCLCLNRIDLNFYKYVNFLKKLLYFIYMYIKCMY